MLLGTPAEARLDIRKSARNFDLYPNAGVRLLFIFPLLSAKAIFSFSIVIIFACFDYSAPQSV